MRFDDAIAFGVKRYGADRRPVSNVARQTRWVEFAGRDVHGVTCCQNRQILAGVALRGTDVPNAAVPMVDVVPTHETDRPGAGGVKVGKTFGGKLGATWQCETAILRRHYRR